MLKLAPLALLLIPTPALAKKDKQIEKLLRMTPDDFAEKVTIQNDELEVAATITTAKGFKYKTGFMNPARADIFLRAFVHKETGATIYQAYYSVTYRGDTWAHIRSANYQTEGGLKSSDVDDIASDVSCERRYCLYMETIGLDLKESDLRWLAGRYKAKTDNPMRIRLKTQNSGNVDTSIMPAEAAGLLSRVDQFKQELGLAEPTAD